MRFAESSRGSLSNPSAAQVYDRRQTNWTQETPSSQKETRRGPRGKKGISPTFSAGITLVKKVAPQRMAASVDSRHRGKVIDVPFPAPLLFAGLLHRKTARTISVHFVRMRAVWLGFSVSPRHLSSKKRLLLSDSLRRRVPPRAGTRALQVSTPVATTPVYKSQNLSKSGPDRRSAVVSRELKLALLFRPPPST